MIEDLEKLSDTLDVANQLAAAEVRNGEKASRDAVAAMPKGEAGDCAKCGYHYERTVGGLCGYCRDGREPPSRLSDENA
jgi:hypothetical protein